MGADLGAGEAFFGGGSESLGSGLAGGAGSVVLDEDPPMVPEGFSGSWGLGWTKLTLFDRW